MTMIVHWTIWSSHRQQVAACGEDGYLWPEPSDPEGIIGVGLPKTPKWFAHHSRPDLVTCPGCLDAAKKAIHDKLSYQSKVESEGYVDFQIKRIQEAVIALGDARSLSAQLAEAKDEILRLQDAIKSAASSLRVLDEDEDFDSDDLLNIADSSKVVKATLLAALQKGAK